MRLKGVSTSVIRAQCLSPRRAAVSSTTKELVDDLHFFVISHRIHATRVNHYLSRTVSVSTGSLSKNNIAPAADITDRTLRKLKTAVLHRDAFLLMNLERRTKTSLVRFYFQTK